MTDQHVNEWMNKKALLGLPILTCVGLWAVTGQHDGVFWMLIG